MLRSLGKKDGGVSALVIAPTRELVLQIFEVLRTLAAPEYKATACYGGQLKPVVLSPQYSFGQSGINKSLEFAGREKVACADIFGCMSVRINEEYGGNGLFEVWRSA